MKRVMGALLAIGVCTAMVVTAPARFYEWLRENWRGALLVSLLTALLVATMCSVAQAKEYKVGDQTVVAAFCLVNEDPRPLIRILQENDDAAYFAHMTDLDKSCVDVRIDPRLAGYGPIPVTVQYVGPTFETPLGCKQIIGFVDTEGQKGYTWTSVDPLACQGI